MASANPFDLLGDNDNDDYTQLVAAAAQQLQKEKAAPKKAPPPSQAAAPQKSAPARLPAKPLPPAQAVREARNEGTGRGGGRGGGRGFGRGGRGPGYNRDLSTNENAFVGAPGGLGGTEEDAAKSSGGRGYYGDRPRSPYRVGGGRRGGFSNGEAGDVERPPRRQFDRRSETGAGDGERPPRRQFDRRSGTGAGDGERPPRRQFDRHSGTGRGNEFKRDGAGRGNWGTPDEVVQEVEEPNAEEKVASPEKPLGVEEAADGNKENTANEAEEKEPEDKEMTLEEYEKVLEEKRKALQALKSEERKVTLDKELESMRQLSNKKSGNDDVFIKLGSDKDKRKEMADKEERAKKAVSINEFLKPADGESYYSSGGRGRGRGRGFRGGYSGGRMSNNVPAPSIMDEGQFPTLGA